MNDPVQYAVFFGRMREIASPDNIHAEFSTQEEAFQEVRVFALQAKWEKIEKFRDLFGYKLYDGVGWYVIEAHKARNPYPRGKAYEGQWFWQFFDEEKGWYYHTLILTGKSRVYEEEG